MMNFMSLEGDTEHSKYNEESNKFEVLHNDVSRDVPTLVSHGLTQVENNSKLLIFGGISNHVLINH